MQFTEEELRIISETGFLRTKASALQNVHRLLEATSLAISEKCADRLSAISTDIKFKPPKISKGENYQGLPYLVLDYPAFFTKEDAFAFRTMFWWGNFYSSTLHLQEASFKMFGKSLVAEFDKLLDKEIFLCVNNTPWEYHYEPSNYRLLQAGDKELIEELPFLKLSKRFDLDDWQQVPSEAAKFLDDLLRLMI